MANPLSMGFVLPDGDDYIKEGDNAISQNARAAADGIEAARRFATEQDESTLDTARDDARSLIETAVDTSHLALDSDGTPYFAPGSMSLRVYADTDGTPYFLEL